MISGMFNFDGRQGHDEESANQPHQWNWATRESSATIALVAILGVSLLSAQMLVRARTGNVLDRQQAVQNAAALISKVAGQGLSYYLGNQTITRYYFHEDENGKNGYMVLSFQPEIQPDGAWILNGRQIYCLEKSIELRETFQVADDLSWYEHKTSVRYLTSGRIEETELRYKEGYLQGAIAFGDTKGAKVIPLPMVSTGGANNLIMSCLLDFFSSVAIDEDYSEGVILALPKVQFRGDPPKLLHTEDLWVRTGGEAPAEVRSAIPNGRCVEVKWLSQSNRFQTVFYDQEHQLVWQKDLPEPASYLRQTTRSEVLAKFPEAEQVLSQMFRMTIDE